MIAYQRILLFYFVYLLIGTPLFGQKYHYKVYSVENGLPQSEIWWNSLLQDKRGSLWVGTNGGGLVRFDGDSKTIFSKKDGLPSNGIRGIFTDKQENLWIVTMAGISKFDGYQFTTYLDTGNIFLNLNSAAIAPQLAEDKFGNIWFRTVTNLFLLQDSAFVNYGASEPHFNGAGFSTSFLDKDGKFWVNTNNGRVWMFNGDHFEPAPIIHSEISEGKNLLASYYDRNYNTWYFTNDPQTGRNQFLMNDGEIWIDFKLPPSCNPSNISDIMIDQNEHIWIANIQSGIYMYDGNKFWEFNRANGMPNNAVTKLLEDYEGNIWASTLGSGLVKIPSTGFTNFSRTDGLPHSIVFSIYEDSKKHIWLGTINHGFCKFDGEKIINFPNLPALTLGRIDAFQEEPSGNMLVASRLSGLFRFNNRTTLPVNAEFGLPAGMGVSVILDDGDRYVFGTFGAGVWIWDKASKTVVQQLNTTNGLNSNLVQDIKKDSKGNFWISAVGGASKFDGTTCTPLLTDENKPLGICLQSHIDAQDNVWIVSYDRGLYRVSNDQLKYFDLMKGESETNLFYSLVQDDQGSLWIGTQQGVDKLELDEQFNIDRIINYRASDGLSGVEMNGRTAMKDSQGRLWFGHLNGVSYYTLSPKVFNETPPVSAITDLELFFERVNWNDESLRSFHEGIEKWYNLPQQLSLPHDQNHLTFKFASMSYTLPEKVKRQWMLEPLNATWLPATNKREATFSSLASGNYTFKVRTQNSDGVWGTPSNFAFKIQSPFWMTWWFWTLSALILIGSIVIGVRVRLQALKEKKAELERLVKVRTAELTNRNEEITMQNAALEQQKEEILTQAEEIEDRNTALASANKEILDQHKNITASITYAKRIQDAMLPRMERIKDALPESFILYEPRDIVSGDFYWFDEQVDEAGKKKIVFAAADCTGHGVPGAFMSMTGDAYLNLVIRNKHILEPNKILDALNTNIGTALKQGITENRDGMDISLCVIDQEARTLEYAGARNPLLYIHHGELKQLKGDKHSIGGSLNGHRFGKQTLHYEPGTIFYMFSDGYVDQFGGPENRKYLIRNFRENLLEIHQFSMEKQQQILLDNLNNWKGDYKQIDDILVIGFRL